MDQVLDALADDLLISTSDVEMIGIGESGEASSSFRPLLVAAMGVSVRLEINRGQGQSKSTYRTRRYVK